MIYLGTKRSAAEERVAALRVEGALEAFLSKSTVGTTRKLVPPRDLLTRKQVGLLRAFARRKFAGEVDFLLALNKVLDSNYDSVESILKIHMSTAVNLMGIPPRRPFRDSW